MRTWGEELEINTFAKSFRSRYSRIRYVISIVPNHENIHSKSNLTVRLYFLNGDHNNFFKTLNENTITANLNKISKEKWKNVQILL